MNKTMGRPRGPGKPFQPGNRFGTGRPNGSRNKATLALPALLDGDGKAITRKAISLAKAGNKTAVRLSETAAGSTPIGDSPRPRRRCVFRQIAFLAAFRITACLSKAAQAARIGRRRHYHWLEQDPDYRLAFEQAKLEVVGELEDEAVRRACGGWLEPVFYQGRQCGTMRRYSDRLLMFLLKGWRPERYR